MADAHQRLASGDDSDSDYENENLRPRGLTGLQNLGNTCYLNSALQSLSNCPPLTGFFLNCPQLVQPEKSPMLSKSYLKLITELWHQKRPSYVVPSGVVAGIKAVHPMFRGYTQQDAQEFLRCLMDQLHEELKSPYSDDDSDSDEEDNNRNDDGNGHSSSNRGDGSNNALKAGEDDAEQMETTITTTAENLERRQSVDSVSSQSELDFETCDSGLSSERSSNGGMESNYCLTDGNNSDSNEAANQTLVADVVDGSQLSLSATGSGDLVRSVSTDAIKTNGETESHCLARSASTDAIKKGQNCNQNDLVANTKEMKETANLLEKSSELSASASDYASGNKNKGKNRKKKTKHNSSTDRTTTETSGLLNADAEGHGDDNNSSMEQAGESRLNGSDVTTATSEEASGNDDKNNGSSNIGPKGNNNKLVVMEAGDSQELGSGEGCGDRSSGSRVGGQTDSRHLGGATEGGGGVEADRGGGQGASVTLSGDGVQTQLQQHMSEPTQEHHQKHSPSTTASHLQKLQKPPQHKQGATASKPRRRKNIRYESIISQTFDGKILSSVRCLNCETVSTIKETFQDLSLPIPSKDHLHMLHSGMTVAPGGVTPPKGGACGEVHQGWIGWMYSWMKSWFVGPNITLQDCLSAFFSADELKGDNMYSCEKCKKLRNGLKYSRVLDLPEILSIHLKRFRHEFYSSKISTYIAFPLEGLDMAPYLHKECNNEAIYYNLVAIICHHGTAGGGHYTAYCLNHLNQQWYEFDDQYVTEVDVSQVLNCEAYVLFYRKSNRKIDSIRQKYTEIDGNESSILRFYISKQWMSRFQTFAEPGPITNGDFLCKHGGVPPGKVKLIDDLVIEINQETWELLHTNFGGGPVCNHLFACQTCRSELESIRLRQRTEKEAFIMLNEEFREEDNSEVVYAISMAWFREWEAFVKEKTNTPPGPIENSRIIVHRNGQPTVRQSSDHGQLSLDMWQFLHRIYGGGPELVVRQSTGASVKTTGSSPGSQGGGGATLKSLAAQAKSGGGASSSSQGGGYRRQGSRSNSESNVKADI